MLAKRLKKLLPSANSCNQTAYVKNRFTGEGEQVAADSLKNGDILKIKALLVTVGKAFESVNHFLMVNVLKESGFGKTLKVDENTFIIQECV